MSRETCFAATEISEECLQDMLYICNGVFSPLTGFMKKAEYRSVVDGMSLPDGSTWTVPITLDVEERVCHEAFGHGRLELRHRGKAVAVVEDLDGFRVTDEDVRKVYGTLSADHPGVRKERSRSPFRIGGAVRLLDESILEGVLSPLDTKAVFQEKGFRTVAGFQTRNAVHRAHEYLQRVALEVCDGLFINPIVGWKKKGDFTEEAVRAAYGKMVSDFYPSDRVHLAGLRTQMRYAGPREAIFHALIRRNLGCTHFIIGRDHAGVGGFYGMYEAHDLARRLMERGSLGIELLLLHGPCYCERCGQIVTEKTCGHPEEFHVPVSGTLMRDCLKRGERPDARFMRPEISEAILSLGQGHIFID